MKMTKKSTWFLFMFVFLLSPNFSIAQSVLRGKVIDAQNEDPLPGATVAISDPSLVTTTDIDGNFALALEKDGQYTLVVSYVGYNTTQVTVSLPQGAPLKIRLKEGVHVTEEVLVTATRASEKTPTTYSTVKKEDLEQNNLGQDIPYLLNLTPSVVVTSDAGAGVGYTGIRIRGSDNTRTNLTVNGIPINDSESSGAFWVNMPDLASSIQNIQIQRGVGSSTNGAGAFGASINIQTNTTNRDAYAEIDNSFGSFNTHKHTIRVGSGLLNEKFAMDARLSSINTDGYIDRASADMKSYYLSGGYYGKSTMVKAVLFSGKQTTYQAWGGTPESRLNNDIEGMKEHAANEGYSQEQLENLLNSGRTYNIYTYENETDNYQQDHYQLHLSQEILKELNFNAALHYTRGRGFYEQYRPNDKFANYGLEPIVIGNEVINRTDLVRRRWLDNHFYGFTYSFQYNPNKLSLTVGGGYNEYEGGHFGEIIWARYASTSAIRDRYYDNDAEKTDFNIYAKGNYQFSDKLNGYLDLQQRRITYNAYGVNNDLRIIEWEATYNFFNPKAGLLYSLDGNTDIYASYAIAQKEPVRNDFKDAPEGKTPKAEKLKNLEVGLKKNSPGFAYAINYYYMDYDDQLVLTGELNDVGSSIRTNVDKSYRTGIELSAAYALGEKVTLAGNLTLSRNRIKNFEEVVYQYLDAGTNTVINEFNDTHISFSPEIIAGGEIATRPLKGLEIALMPKYVGEQYLDNTANEDRKIAGYFVSDLRMAYALPVNWAKEIKFNFLINNIFDAQYVSNGFTYSYIVGDGYNVTENFYYPQAGINFLAGLSVKF